MNPCHINYKKVTFGNTIKVSNKREDEKEIKSKTSKKIPEIKDNTSTYIRIIDKGKILKKKNGKIEIKNKNIEQFGQDYKCLDFMKQNPPKEPQIYEHVYNLRNRNALFKENETLSALNKDNIPIVFYDHMFFNEKKKYKKCKYSKTSITLRNKKKLITLIYYSP